MNLTGLRGVRWGSSAATLSCDDETTRRPVVQMRLEVHLMNWGKDDKAEVRGIVRLRNGRVEFDEEAEKSLTATGHLSVINPVNISTRLTPKHGIAYMLALPLNLRGSYCWAAIPGLDFQKTSFEELFDAFGIVLDAGKRSTAARYRTGPAARVCETVPPDDQLLGCWSCGWLGSVNQAPAEYFSECWHRECPECEQMLLVLPYEQPPLLKPPAADEAPRKAEVRIRFTEDGIELAGIPGPNGEPPADVGNVGDDPDAIYLSRTRRRK